MKNQFLHINYPINLMSLLGKKEEEEKGLESIILKAYDRKEHVYYAEEKANKIYIVKKGRVKIEYNDENDKVIIKNVFMPGELFGEAALFGQRYRSDTAIAMEKTELYILSPQELFRQMKYQSGLTSYIINLL